MAGLCGLCGCGSGGWGRGGAVWVEDRGWVGGATWAEGLQAPGPGRGLRLGEAQEGAGPPPFNATLGARVGGGLCW